MHASKFASNLARGLLLAGTVMSGITATAAAAQAQVTLSAEELQAMRDEIEALRAEVDAHADVLAKGNSDIANLNKLKPSFKAAPEFKDGDWKFKVRGRFMYDVGYITNPNDAVPGKNLGFNSGIRRARLGVEGSMPGQFNYKIEVDFANNAVAFADAYLEYKPNNTPLFFRVGHMETFESLEQVTSSRHIMFLERAQMNEAFNNTRRLGGSIGFDKGPLLLNLGVFNETVNANSDNDQYIVATRGTYSPKVGDTQLHFGINYQYRTYKSNLQQFQYRARNYVRASSVRMVDTGPIAMSNDELFGLEAAAIHNRFWAAAEFQQAKVNAINAPLVGNGDTAGTPVAYLAGNPTFKSWYIEGGYWWTGETRGYKKGEWDRTKVINGFDKGGIGAIATTLRFDRLDLRDDALRTGTTAGAAPAQALRGGKQDAIVGSIVWQPIDYVRITAQYAHYMITGGPFAGLIDPTSTKPIWERDYTQDSFGMRFAFDW